MIWPYLKISGNDLSGPKISNVDFNSASVTSGHRFETEKFSSEILKQTGVDK
jgi:hypothetical protein